MSITWINPAALAGLALIALPIAIHLLVRQQTRVAAVSVAAVPAGNGAGGVPAAGDPGRGIARMPHRRSCGGGDGAGRAGRADRVPTCGYANRPGIARDRSRSDRARRGRRDPGDAFRTATFERTRLADAIADAMRWLDAQPPSAREIVSPDRFGAARSMRATACGAARHRHPNRCGTAAERAPASSPTLAADTPQWHRSVRIDQHRARRRRCDSQWTKGGDGPCRKIECA